MTNVKTAVSLQKSLFEQTEALADELQISRSRLFSLALQDFVRRSRNRQLLEKLDTVYKDKVDATEQTLRRRRRCHHRRIVEGEW